MVLVFVYDEMLSLEEDICIVFIVVSFQSSKMMSLCEDWFPSAGFVGPTTRWGRLYRVGISGNPQTLCGSENAMEVSKRKKNPGSWFDMPFEAVNPTESMDVGDCIDGVAYDG